jgi:hypothetical protein
MANPIRIRLDLPEHMPKQITDSINLHSETLVIQQITLEGRIKKTISISIRTQKMMFSDETIY